MGHKPLLGKYRAGKYKGSPWHFRKFIEGKTDDLPFDRDGIVLYHGASLSDFYTEEHTEGTGNYNKRSVLETEVKKPGNTFQEGGTDDYEEFSYEDEAVFGGVLEIAYEFAKERHEPYNESYGLVYEFELPSKSMEMLIGDTCIHKWLELDVPDPDGRFYHINSSEELIKLLGGPENSRSVAIENLRQAIRTMVSKSAKSSRKEIAEQVQFGTQYKVNLDKTTGLWPLKYSQKPVFLDQEKFLEWLYFTAQKIS